MRGGDTGEFKANVEGNSMKQISLGSALSEQVWGYEKAPAFWEETAGPKVYLHKQGGTAWRVTFLTAMQQCKCYNKKFCVYTA